MDFHQSIHKRMAMFFSLLGQLVLEKENSEFKPAKRRLKIDLVSYPARMEGLVNIYI